MGVVYSTVLPISIAILSLAFVSPTLEDAVNDCKFDLLFYFIVEGFEAFDELVGFAVESLEVENNGDDLCFFGGELNLHDDLILGSGKQIHQLFSVLVIDEDGSNLQFVPYCYSSLYHIRRPSLLLFSRESDYPLLSPSGHPILVRELPSSQTNILLSVSAGRNSLQSGDNLHIES